jgi:hypothetical protein
MLAGMYDRYGKQSDLGVIHQIRSDQIKKYKQITCVFSKELMDM